jgi:non-ribosomal peptide synthetase component F
LDTVSSALAEELIDYNIGVDMTIPVLLEKSRWVPVAVVGVLKTGASFVLMDASHPEARLRGLCEDIQAPLILASRGTFSKASNLAPHVVCLGERLLGEVATHPPPARWTRVPVCASNTAYTVFTSGSTGKPKGAILDHSCLATAAKHFHSCMYLNSASRVLQFSSHAWDIAVADIVLTLLAGGCVCIPSEEERTGDIAAAANRMRVNWAVLTPTVSRLVKPGDLKHLQTLVLAGRALVTIGPGHLAR